LRRYFTLNQSVASELVKINIIQKSKNTPVVEKGRGRTVETCQQCKYLHIVIIINCYFSCIN